MESDAGGQEQEVEVEVEELWVETETLLLRVFSLHHEAQQRTESLLSRLNADWILSCHLASLEDVRSTGEITFGQRLLAHLQS